MSSAHVLSAQERTSAGTGSARAVRRLSLVPGVIYGDSKDPVMVAIPEKELLQECSTPGFYSRILTLNVNGTEQKVIAKDVQYHPVTDFPLHVDFQRVSANSRVRAHVPVHYINEDKVPAIKRGATLNIIVHNLEIICAPHEIPESFTVDLTSIETKHSLTIEEVSLPASAKAANPNRDHVLATLVGAKAEAQEAESA